MWETESERRRQSQEWLLEAQGYSCYGLYDKREAARVIKMLQKSGYRVKDIAMPFQDDESVRMHVLYVRLKR